jgi:hypothetical protein
VPHIRQLLSFISFAAFASAALADTPNLQPGLWAYDNVSTIEGPLNLPPQNHSNQECLKQDDLDKGVDMLNIPESCTITRADIYRDKTEFAATCDMSGIASSYQGFANFHGDHLDGKMTSEMDSPLGKIIMHMNFTAKRVGDC